ncbi:MAG: GNAT family N-acetyltransferase [Clostridia bacterium]|nr:GNAT family N-acetyltransferase [Clostridia bacterium]
MIISTERLILRPFCIEDLDDFFNILQEDKIEKYLPGIYSNNKEEIRENIEIYQNADFSNDFYYAIIDKQTNKIIGAIVCVRTIGNTYDMSYFISKFQRDKGYMFEALEAFCRSIKKTIVRAIVHFFVKKDNKESIRLLEKLRAKLVCVHKMSLEFII